MKLIPSYKLKFKYNTKILFYNFIVICKIITLIISNRFSATRLCNEIAYTMRRRKEKNTVQVIYNIINYYHTTVKFTKIVCYIIFICYSYTINI